MSDPRLEQIAEALQAYMRDCMSMPDSETDQEQNWIAGHMLTFTSSIALQATGRAETPQEPVAEGRDESAARIKELQEERNELRSCLNTANEHLKRFIARAEAAEAKLAAQGAPTRAEGRSAWQSIETAPPMQNVILGDHGSVTVGYRLGKGRWVDSLNDDGFTFSQPTHWMPLPAPTEGDVTT
jgi:Mg2+ and Co2+ transporter CorA